MLKALHRFTQLLRVHIYVPGCCKYIRMTNGLQPLVELCMDGCFADFADIRFSAFANAAFLRTGGSISLIAQRISRYRIFNGAQFIRFGTDLSQRSEPTIDNQHVDKALLR